MKIFVVFGLIFWAFCQFSDEVSIVDLYNDPFDFDVKLERVKRQDFENDPEIPRSKPKHFQPPRRVQTPALNLRELTCQIQTYPTCCGKKKEMDPESNLKKAFDECLIKNFGDPSMFQMYPCSEQQEMTLKFTCVYECVALKMNLVSKEGQLNEEVFLNISQEMYMVDEWQNDFINESVQTALKDIQKKNLTNTFLNEISCSPKIQVLLFNYIWLYQQIRCPNQYAVKTNTCLFVMKKIRQGVPRRVGSSKNRTSTPKPELAKEKKPTKIHKKLPKEIRRKMTLDDDIGSDDQ